MIEKLDPDTGKWTKAGTSRFAHTIVENLLPNKQYQFRILAENIFGAGPASEPTKPIQTSGKSLSITNSRHLNDIDAGYLESEASRKRRLGKDDDLLRRKNKDLPRLDNYDRCCKYCL